MRTLLTVVAGLCIIAVSLSLDEADQVVPETNLVVPQESFEQQLYTIHDDDDHLSSFEAAREKVNEMTRAGKDDAACRKLGSETKKQVEDSVKDTKKVLDALPDGSACTSAHDKTVADAKAAKTKADEAYKKAASAAEKACNQEVDFGKYRLSDLTPGECSQFFNSAAYKSAQQECKDANEKKQSAAGAKDQADKGLESAKKQAAKDLHSCLCTVQKTTKEAWEAATKSHATDKKSWDFAHHITCVLDHTPADKCDVPSCPVVTKPTMTDAAQNEVCNECSLDETTTHYSPCGITEGKHMQYLDRLPVKCGKDEALTSFRLGRYGCKNDHQQYKFTCGAAKFTKVTQRSTSCQVLDGKDAQYLDRQNVQCGGDEVLTGFKVVRNGCNGKDMRYYLDCGKLPVAEDAVTTTHKSKCTPIKSKKLQFLDKQTVQCSTGSAMSQFRLLDKRGCDSKGKDFRYHFTCRGC